jgi:hypothetical protein
MTKFYPIGTVVTLVGGTIPIMIYGRLQFRADTDDIFDYVACLYPEGNIGEDYNIFFYHDDIETVHFVGYKTPEEEQMHALLVEFLEEQARLGKTAERKDLHLIYNKDNKEPQN